jgi:hypothetical protein
MKSEWADEIYDVLSEKILPKAEDYVQIANLAIINNDVHTSYKAIEAGHYLYPGNMKLLQRLKLINKYTSFKNITGVNKVFGIGLSRTGTTSLNACLNILGFDSKHWMINNKIIDWLDIFNFNGLTDTPISFQFESIYYAFPKAKFIYTIRDSHIWEKSVERHFHWIRDFNHFKDICNNGVSGKSIVNSEYWRAIHLNLYANYSSWLEAYEAHDARVKNFFQGCRKTNLLEINLTTSLTSNKQKWLTILEFLEMDLSSIPLMPFPKKNIKNQPQNNDLNFFANFRDSWRVDLEIEKFEHLLREFNLTRPRVSMRG